MTTHGPGSTCTPRPNCDASIRAHDPQPDLDTVQWLIKLRRGAALRWLHARTATDFHHLAAAHRSDLMWTSMLGTYSEVCSAGELTDFGTAVTGYALVCSALHAPPLFLRKDSVMSSARLEFAALGADYLRRVQPRLRQQLPRFTDKLPLNYLYCGLIARALPSARIVHVTRHPMAVCYAMYKVLFDQGYPFSYDLGEIADYYVAYRRLMEHWRRSLPGRLYEVAYEDLVSDPEGQGRALLAALDLAWQDQCLQSHDNTAPVATASKPAGAPSDLHVQHFAVAALRAGSRHRSDRGCVAAGVALDP